MIPLHKRQGKIWMNGEYIDWQDSHIHVLTHGLHYASCVYEGIRIYKSKPFLLDLHLNRLVKSAQILDMKFEYSVEHLKEVTEKLVNLQNISYGYIRPFVWRGSEQLKISSSNNQIHVAIACWETEDRYKTRFDPNNGYKLTFGDYRRAPAECYPYESKSSGAYTISTIEKHKSEKLGFDDAILLDYHGDITETTSSNIFFIFGNELHTTIPDCFLNGITRQKVIEMAKDMGITVVERKIKYEEYLEANDAFVTGTAIEVTPVNSISHNGNNISYQRHKITTEIFNEFNKFVFD